jgi:hypothetical protein
MARLKQYERQVIVTNNKQKRNILDDLMDLGRDILDKIDEALLPKHSERQPVRVPVPVRNDRPRHPQQDPYNQNY